MKGAFDARGQVLCLDLPDQRLGGAEHEDQGLLVAQQRLDGLQMQLNLVRKRGKKKRRERLESHKATNMLVKQYQCTEEEIKAKFMMEISRSTSHEPVSHSYGVQMSKKKKALIFLMLARCERKNIRR